MNIKNTWNQLKNSFYNPEFYASVPNQSLKKGLKFVFVLTAVSVVVFVLGLLVSIVPDIKSFSGHDFIEKNYPEELVINIKEGVASTNVVEPYYIPSTLEKGKNAQANLVVIDTKTDVSLSEITSYDSFVLLTKDHVVLNQPGRETRILPLKSIKELTVSKETTQALVSKFTEFLPWFVAIATIFGTFIGILFCFVITLINLLWLSLVTLVVGKVRKIKLTYKQAYTVSLYAFAPVVVVDMISMILRMGSLSFWVTLVLFILVLALNLGVDKQVARE
jgi:hypothetical protein